MKILDSPASTILVTNSDGARYAITRSLPVFWSHHRAGHPEGRWRGAGIAAGLPVVGRKSDETAVGLSGYAARNGPVASDWHCPGRRLLDRLDVDDHRRAIAAAARRG